MDRRKFLLNSGLAAGATLAMPALSCTTQPKEEAPLESFDDWIGIRNQFKLAPDRIHMAQMLLASHPAPVRRAIEMHRKHFDENPTEYWEENFVQMDKRVAEAAARYINAGAEEVALTDSTSMGLGILYTGFKLKSGDEILTTTHDHYATEKSLEFAASRNGATINRISLYTDAATVTVDQVADTLKKSITDKTKIVAVTWVHSSTGVKLPIGEMAKVIKEVNSQRGADKRIYFCVDGVHGFGIEDVSMEDLGCDFFSAGTHKWIFGPRGTGILWGKKDAWDMVVPVIPSFGEVSYYQWLGQMKDSPLTFNDWCSPGGFHSFEHRWSLNEAFDFHLKIGKKIVQDRTHQLGIKLREGLKNIKHIKLHTPMSASLSSGINCFEVDGLTPEEVVKKLTAKKIISSFSPYAVSYARLTPNIANTEEEVNKCIDALEKIKG
ncbi:MAG: aminotransferase class V-fold PLP-dependent enzyme [Cyclobacteriaceae bacterium]|nr:aminotransferase class V-fold PLP-dependent enzyme [Cyclobacteriaceae bacterium]